jgi:hypothetical protein
MIVFKKFENRKKLKHLFEWISAKIKYETIAVTVFLEINFEFFKNRISYSNQII